MNTEQIKHWHGDFGAEYAIRNLQGAAEMDEKIRKRYVCGKSRTELNEELLEGIDRSSSVLEVGTNIGNQLLCLRAMGFENLFGIDLRRDVVNEANRRVPNADIICGSAFDIPFKDGYFDIVFTSGVLIHIAPCDLAMAMGEIYRCSNRYIWGMEYWAKEIEGVEYRGHENLLWRGNYSEMFMQQFLNLAAVMARRLRYVGSQNVDEMFLLRKD
jgi:pseudaminic acid biosynthesis-associated methylase